MRTFVLALRMGVALATVALLAGACNVGAPPVATPTPGNPETNPATVLLVVEAGGGTWEQTSESTARLTLTGVGPQLTWFNDRPYRKAGQMDVQQALDALYNDGTPDPPNAALSVHNARASDQDQVAILELTDPAYDPAAGTLAFTAALLDQPRQGLEFWAAKPRARGVTPLFDHASLFIDNIFTYNYCGGTLNNNSQYGLEWSTENLNGGSWYDYPNHYVAAGSSMYYIAQSSGSGDDCTLYIAFHTDDAGETSGVEINVSSPASSDNSGSAYVQGTGCSVQYSLESTSGNTARLDVGFSCP